MGQSRQAVILKRVRMVMTYEEAYQRGFERACRAALEAGNQEDIEEQQEERRRSSFT